MFGKKENKNEDFETECTQHIDALYATAYKLTGNQADAEELVQNTYLRAFRFKKQFQWGSNLKAWLFKILTNTFINDHRHKKNHHKYVERTANEPLYDRVLSSEAQKYSSNPENHIFAKYFKDELETALDKLPDDFKQVILLSDVQGFSYKETAEILDAPMGTVMSRLHRGRKLLQKQLIDYAVDAGVITPSDSDNTDSATGALEPSNLEEYRQKMSEVAK